eukprot:maker-scaffold855_size87859-snap-gene-0.11 protein:Tk02428 transcript:maker-scaffold855_size87859-snap-gene-0.11-mRNA-1 annotation:"hypothetical protein EUTSA_v10012875mg"
MSSNGTIDHHEEHGEHEADHVMTHMVKNMTTNTSASTISKLIETLRDRLKGLEVEPLPKEVHNHEEHHHERTGNPSVDDLIHGDTMILVGSCFFMIVLGLLLRKTFMYFTHLRSHRDKCQGGLRQMGEQMHVVTRTMSTDPNQTFALDTPQVVKKPLSPQPSNVLANNNGATIAETSLDDIMPYSHTMLVDESDDIRTLTTAREALEARRLSKMKNFLETQD